MRQTSYGFEKFYYQIDPLNWFARFDMDSQIASENSQKHTWKYIY